MLVMSNKQLRRLAEAFVKLSGKLEFSGLTNSANPLPPLKGVSTPQWGVDANRPSRQARRGTMLCMVEGL